MEAAGQPPGPNLTLRPLDASHTVLLQALYEDCGDYFESAAGRRPRSGQAGHDLAEAAADEARHLLGIHLAEQMVGLIDLRLADPGPFDVRLGLVLVAPAYRRQGLGGLALRILEEWLRRATPTDAVVAAVQAQDYAAQGFFTAHGYAFTGEATRLVMGSSRLRLLTMRKRIV